LSERRRLSKTAGRPPSVGPPHFRLSRRYARKTLAARKPWCEISNHQVVNKA
jgi:hypothetical protein